MTARRQESTRLTWPMPMPTLARPAASRMALDLTARQARQANSRSASTAASAGLPATSRQFAAESPGSVPVSARLHQHAAADLPPVQPSAAPSAPAAAAGAGQLAAQQPLVLLRGQDLQRAGLEVRGDDHLGEDLRDLRGHLLGHGAVRRDHAAERRHRVAGVRHCGALRRGRRRARCRTGWRAS